MRDETTTTRSEEELIVDRVREPAGTVEVHKRVDTFTVEEERHAGSIAR